MSESFVGQGIFRVSRVTKVGSGKYEPSGSGVVGAFDGFSGGFWGSIGTISILLMCNDAHLSQYVAMPRGQHQKQGMRLDMQRHHIGLGVAALDVGIAVCKRRDCGDINAVP